MKIIKFEFEKVLKNKIVIGSLVIAALGGSRIERPV